MNGLAPLPWIATDPRSRGQLGECRVRMFLLPHAGGGASSYRLWPALLPADVDVRPVLLPGREHRFNEPAIDRMDRLLDGLVPAIIPLLNRPYVLFGHSMGACIAHALAHRLADPAQRPPALLILSGRNAPSTPRATPSLHDRPDAEFLDGLRRLGGTPPEVLENQELMDLVMPTLRADFALANTCVPTSSPLRSPILVIGGADDPETTMAGLAAWTACTIGSTRVVTLPGGHFFTETQRGPLLALLADALHSIGGDTMSQRSPCDAY
jgi:medium-chain acyl-[acyl-carrier-protein] hydrolase